MTLTDPSMVRFAALAESFCALVEDRGSMTAEALLGGVHLLLPQLYAAALVLPGVEFIPDDPVEDEVDGEEKRTATLPRSRWCSRPIRTRSW